LRPVEPSNDLNDEQKAKLFITGITRLERLIERKDSAVADIRSHRKTMKSEGFSREEVEYALWLRKAGEEVAKERMAAHLRIAEWLEKPLGFQSTFNLAAAQ
jgi:uncharacterized protein (UPF0335 family)